MDFLIYFLTTSLLWALIGYFSNNELTEEIGGLIGLMILGVYTIIFFLVRKYTTLFDMNQETKFYVVLGIFLLILVVRAIMTPSDLNWPQNEKREEEN